MSSTVLHLLSVGQIRPNLLATLKRLMTRGWGSHSVDTLEEARVVLKTFRFDVVLASENLEDGRGYDLQEIVTRQANSLFVAVALTGNCLWLPVIERGARTLGARALSSSALELELEDLLTPRPTKPVRSAAPASASRVAGTQACAKESGGDPMAISFAEALIQSALTSAGVDSRQRPAAAKTEIPERRKSVAEIPVAKPETLPGPSRVLRAVQKGEVHEDNQENGRKAGKRPSEGRANEAADHSPRSTARHRTVAAGLHPASRPH